jgi:hypothetical protein
MTLRPRRSRRHLTGPLLLEDRVVPATFTAVIDPATDDAGAVAELVNIFNQANADAGTTETINLFAGGTYEFNDAADPDDGGTALPVLFESDPTILYSPGYIPKTFTINGGGATFDRPAGAPSFRFLRAVGQVDSTQMPSGDTTAVGPTLVVNNLTLNNGNTYDFSGGNFTDPKLFPVLDGGAIRLDNADIRTNGVNFTNDTATDNGGAVALDARLGFLGDGQFNTTTFTNNYTGLVGGAVYVTQTGTAPAILTGFTFTDSTLTGNVSLTGAGGAGGEPVEYDFVRTKIANNTGAVGGVSGSLVRATDSLFQANVATGTGPGAVIATGNILSLINTTVTANTSSTGGAVIGQSQGRAVELVNSTIDGNIGGAAAVEAPVGEVVLTFSTITNNRATLGDVAGVKVDANILTIYGTIIAGNRVTDPLSPFVEIEAQQIRDNDYNLIGVAATGFIGAAHDLVGAVGSELDPKLSPLDFYGGISGLTLTRRPATGSPVIDAAGTPIATRVNLDQRGLPRPDTASGLADIGAVEVQAAETLTAAQPPLPQVPQPPPPPPPPPPAVPAIFTATINPAVDLAGALTEIIGFFKSANTNAAQFDTINLWPGGVYTFNSAIEKFDGGTALPVIDTASENLTINGLGASFVRPAGAPSFRFLRAIGGANGGPDLTISSLSLIGGNVFDLSAGNRLDPAARADLSGGAILLDNADVNATNVSFLRNTSTDGGGAVALESQFGFVGNSHFTGTTFSQNYAGGSGGGVLFATPATSQPEIQMVKVSGSGTFALTFPPGSGDTTINLAAGVDASIVAAALNALPSIGGVGGKVIVGNTLDVSGAVYTIEFGGSLADLNVPQITATAAGGSTVAVSTVQNGLNVNSSFTTFGFTGDTFDSNVSLTGAGAIDGQGEVDLTTTKITNNSGAVGGVSGTLVNVTSSLFEGNAATGSGPSAVIATGNMLTLVNSTITLNRSAIAGAAVGLATGEAVELLNTTVDSNTGGAAAISAPVGEIVLSFATVTNNKATSGNAAGVNAVANIIDVYASVVANNRVSDPLSTTVDLSAAQIRNNRFNLIGVAPASYPVFPGDLFGTAGAPLDPKLSALGDHGGVPGITLTRLPTAGSPVINAAGIPGATRITTDERGLARVVGPAADIGAAELQANDPSLAPQSPPPPLIPPPPPPSPPPPPPATLPTVAVAPGAPKNFGTAAPPTVITVSGTTVGTTLTPPNEVRLEKPDGTVTLSVAPFGGSVPGGLRVASADVTGDGVADLIVATGPGVLDSVVVIDGGSGQKVTQFTPFEGFTGGLFVTTGDLTGDGRPDIVITADNGGGPRVTIYDATNYSVFVNFFGIADVNFRGGARAAVGDFNRDGVNDLAIAAGPGGGPRVSIYDGTSRSGGAYTAKLVPDFFLFDTSLRDGVFIAAGDVNADGYSDLIVGAGAGGGPRVFVVSGQALTQQGIISPLADFFSGDPSLRDGVNVASHDVDGDGRADILTGSGANSTVRIFLGSNLSGTPSSQFDPFAGFLGGVNVG